MQEKELKTTTSQRIIIIIIAILLLGSTITTYLAIVFAGNKSKSENDLSKDPDYIAIQDEFQKKQDEFTKRSDEFSEKYIDTLKKYKANIKGYNAETANKDGLKTNDLEVGTGREISEGDLEYFSYYIGWCPDESVFDSSFNDKDNPTALKMPTSPKIGLIEGWNQGVVGMKMGGVREVTIPGELAYGDKQEICGSTNSPLKFIILAFEDEKLSKLNDELQEVYQKKTAMEQKASSNDDTGAGNSADAVVEDTGNTATEEK